MSSFLSDFCRLPYRRQCGKTHRVDLLAAYCNFITGLLLQPQHPTAKFLTNGIILEFILGMLAFKMTHNRHLTKLLCALLALSGLLLLIIQNQTGIYHSAAGRVISGGIPMFLFFTGVVGLENDIKQSSVPGIKHVC